MFLTSKKQITIARVQLNHEGGHSVCSAGDLQQNPPC